MKIHYMCAMVVILFAAVVVPLADASPVEEATFWEDTSFQPHIDVFQEADETGRLRFTRIEPQINKVVGHAYGYCGAVYRMRKVYVHTWYQDLDGSRQADQIEVSPSSPLSEEIASFDVDPDKRTFGTHVAEMELPSEWLTWHLTHLGENLVVETAAARGITIGEMRELDFGGPIDIGLTLFVVCRAPLESPTKQWYKTTLGWFPLRVIFRGIRDMSVDENGFVVETDPQEGPSAQGGGLAARVRIDGNNLIVIPEQRPGSCRLNLSGSLRTSAPTQITYRFRDHTGAASPVQSVAVDQSSVAFVSQAVDLLEPDDGTLDLTFESPSGRGNGGVSIDGGLQQEPTSRVRGFYQMETVQPYKTLSNIAGYNLDECAVEEIPMIRVNRPFRVVSPREREDDKPGYPSKPTAQ